MGHLLVPGAGKKNLMCRYGTYIPTYRTYQMIITGIITVRDLSNTYSISLFLYKGVTFFIKWTAHLVPRYRTYLICGISGIVR